MSTKAKLKPGDLVKLYEIYDSWDSPKSVRLDTDLRQLHGSIVSTSLLYYPTHNPILYLGSEKDKHIGEYYKFLHQDKIWFFRIYEINLTLDDFFYKVVDSQ